MTPRDAIARAMEARRAGRAGAGADMLAALDTGPAEVSLARGALLGEARRLDEAMDCLRAAHARHPGHAGGLYNLARIVQDAGDKAQAAGLFERVLALAPGMQQAWRGYGNCLVDLGHVDDAVAAYDRNVALLRGAATHDAAHADYRTTTPAKLRHDMEQMLWLAEAGVALDGGADPAALAERCAAALALVEGRAQGQEVVALEPGEARLLAGAYNLLLHRPPGARLAGGALDPAIDWRAVERRYAETAHGITWIDGLLSPEALEGIRRHCLAATVWFRFRFPKGYVGAFWDEGFASPLMLQVSDELRHAAPSSFGAHSLRKIWAFKYDARLDGIPIHADFAAVNVNFWVTPDEANLDPEGGGLVVWDREAPSGWDFARYNT
ncbi:MAG: tetratricopeptide repeat protein, partial [Alphaproteobacteria bacterium]